jgi:hypothetical protein
MAAVPELPVRIGAHGHAKGERAVGVLRHVQPRQINLGNATYRWESHSNERRRPTPQPRASANYLSQPPTTGHSHTRELFRAVLGQARLTVPLHRVRHWLVARAHARPEARRSSPARTTPAIAGSRSPHRYSSPIRSTRYAAPIAGPHRSHVSLISPSPATALPGLAPSLEHRRAGSTVQDVDLGGSPSLPHHPAEQGTDLLRVEGHAPGGITAAYAGLDDALVVTETTHRPPPSPFTGTEEPEGPI